METLTDSKKGEILIKLSNSEKIAFSEDLKHELFQYKLQEQIKSFLVRYRKTYRD